MTIQAAALARRYRSARRLAAASVAAGAGLGLFKIAAGLAGGSAAAVADGIESACDALTSALLLGGLAVSALPADAEHPYGHERAENVTAVLLALGLLAAGIAVALGAIHGLGTRAEPPALFTLVPLVVSVAVKTGLAGAKARLARRGGSGAVRVEAFHDAADVVSGGLAITGVLLARLGPPGWLLADRVAAGLVGMLIISLGGRLLRGGLSSLLDEAPPPDFVRRLKAAAAAVRGVRGVEKCLGRRSGTGYFVDLHLLVPPELTVREAHALGHRVKEKLLAHEHKLRDILVHVEPAASPGPKRASIKG